MASVPDSRSGAGGKMVTNRRRQRLSATPYDRPLPSPSPKSPNWFTGVVIHSARALASGAGKFISSAIFSDSESSSSEDFDSASEDDADNINEYESPRDGVNALNEEKLTGGEMKEYGRESQLIMQRSETKWLIEQLIMQENFSREECDRLTKVLHSRVNHWSVETGDKRSIANSPRQTDEDPYILNKAVQEARNWFQEKKGGSSSVAEFAHGTCNLNSAAIDHMEIGAGSPVDMARSYMKERPPWASPTKHVELRTPLTTTMKLFKERTPYSVTEDILSSSQRRSSLASESWNIQEELRKVRSKAVEDMLRTPPAKYDSLFSIAATKEESMGAGGVGEEIFKPHSFWKTKPIDAFMDVGVNADPALVALESRQDAKGSETPSSHPDASASEINKDPETFRSDGVHAPSMLSHPTSPVHADQHHSADPHAGKISGPPETGVAEPGGSPCTNGFTPAQASSPEAVGAQNSKQYDVENHNDTASNNSMPTNGTTNMDGNCELLTEAYMEVPIVTETDSINSGSHISVDTQNEESQLETTKPSAEEKPEVVATAKQQAKKVGRTTRRSSRTKGK
ncbi:uncharacterized protein LOC121741921 isoform X2 [Salvia splendens]|uniref:uncharacterized protein LOC121741921 isoform X2 n=1 Tax=Salvia splendens TaxID=180675 RepID=UPI001C26DD17|nr:uncharacterized protein LOC121741921 isoform X2 [Salvia splendens]